MLQAPARLLAASLALLVVSPARTWGEPAAPPRLTPGGPPDGPPVDPPRPAAPHLRLSERGSGFWGPGRERPDPPLPPSVKIGLVGPAEGELGLELRRGATLALERANATGGFRGRPFELVFVPDDGAWGVAAGKVVQLAHRERVWAIVGGLDGHHVHLAELVVAKLWVPVITPWARDRTVDFANVPWVFRCGPDDGAQAAALLEHARAATATSPLLLIEDEREARTAAERCQEAAGRLGLPRLEELRWPAAGAPRSFVKASVSLTRLPPSVVVWGRRARAVELLQALREGGYQGLLLAPGHLVGPRARALAGLVVAAGYDPGSPSQELVQLRQRYAAAFGQRPDPLAAYTWDALSLVVAAIREAGLNRARIRDRMAASERLGATGRLRFNSLGGAVAAPVLLRATPTRWEPATE